MISPALLLFIFHPAQAGEGGPGAVPAHQEMILGGIASGAAPILAEISALDWKLFAALAGLIVAVAALVPAWQFLTGQNKATRVQIEEPFPHFRHEPPRFATYEELQALRVEFHAMRNDYSEHSRAIESKVEKAKLDLLEAGEQRAIAIHERINQLGEKLGMVIGELRHAKFKDRP